MAFRELLEKYRDGTATPAEREAVEQELEKFDALGEYMLEQEPPEAEAGLEPPPGELQKIRRSLKRRSLLLVCIAAAAACGVVAAANALEPALSKLLWYDPTEVYTPDSGEYSTQKLDSHIAVMTELLMPEVRMENATIVPQGWGKYALSIWKYDLSSGEQDNVSGSIVRGGVSFANEFYNTCILNMFSRSAPGLSAKPEPMGVVKDKETARNALAGLPDYIWLEGYVSLGRDWSMEELAAFQEKTEQASERGWLGWVGVRCAPEGTQRIPLAGFQADTSGWILSEVEERYPYYEISAHDGEPLAEVWAAHFNALLQYAADHEDFYRRIESNGGRPFMDVKGAQKYVEQNGVNTYGFVYYGTPEDFLRILEEPDIEGLSIADSRIEVWL